LASSAPLHILANYHLPLNRALGKQINFMPRFTVPTTILLIAISLVAVNSVFLPQVSGYGTILYQVVMLSSALLVNGFTNIPLSEVGKYWFILALVFVNLILFLIPTLTVWGIGKNRWPKFTSITVAVFSIVFILSLYVLFPATDGT
jgi:hypothetical protein